MTSGGDLYCSFRLGGRLFGVPIPDVKEVTTETAVTRIPHAPPAVLGYVNLRGHVQLVLDLRLLLGMPPVAVSADSRLVIFKPAVGDSFGVRVDAVGEIVAVPRDRIEERRATEADAGDPSGEAGADGLVAGVAKLPADLLVILQPRRFLPAVAGAMTSG